MRNLIVLMVLLLMVISCEGDRTYIVYDGDVSCCSEVSFEMDSIALCTQEAADDFCQKIGRFVRAKSFDCLALKVICTDCEE